MREHGGAAPAAPGDLELTLATGEPWPAYYARAGDTPRPAVVIIHDIFGRSPFYEGLARRVAAAGHDALLPDLFFREGPLPAPTLEAAFARRDRLDERRTLDDLSQAVDRLKDRTGSNAARTATIGFCMGGTLSLDLAAQRDDLVTICYYAFPAPDPSASSRRAPAPLDLVDRISGPILGFWGDRDESVGIPNVIRLADELTKRGVEFEHVLYPGLSHGFLAAADFRPEHEAYPAASDAWSRTLRFLDERLR